MFGQRLLIIEYYNQCSLKCDTLVRKMVLNLAILLPYTLERDVSTKTFGFNKMVCIPILQNLSVNI